MIAMHKMKRWRAPFFRLLLRGKPSFECPICGYEGPFKDKQAKRWHAKCPACGELERARLHYLVLQEVLSGRNTKSMDVLHFAPETSFREYFCSGEFGGYTSADLYRTDVDCSCDVQSIPYPDSSFDLVFASHVLEYPEDDLLAMREILRVLRPGGLALLTVPLVHHTTVDRATRHPVSKMMHEPGLDYFDRMSTVFPVVRQYRSSDFPEKFQLFLRLNTIAANREPPLEIRPGIFEEVVPVCFKTP